MCSLMLNNISLNLLLGHRVDNVYLAIGDNIQPFFLADVLVFIPRDNV